LKVFIEFDTDKDLTVQLEHAKVFLLENRKNINPGQQQINSSTNPKKIICMRCGEDLHTKYDDETVTKIVNFCKIKYKVKGTDKSNVFCKDCQPHVNTGGD